MNNEDGGGVEEESLDDDDGCCCWLRFSVDGVWRIEALSLMDDEGRCCCWFMNGAETDDGDDE